MPKNAITDKATGEHEYVYYRVFEFDGDVSEYIKHVRMFLFDSKSQVEICPSDEVPDIKDLNGGTVIRYTNPTGTHYDVYWSDE